jgi:hypothetical protein
VILGRARQAAFADFGQGVPDTAMVETAAYCLEWAGNADPARAHGGISVTPVK